MAAAAYAQPTETYHVFDVDVPASHGLTVTLHSRLRTQSQTPGPYEARFGPIITCRVSPRQTLAAGYYYTEQKDTEAYRTIHRPFVGASTTILSNASTELSARVSAERFLITGRPDFNRYRGRVRLAAKGRVAPYSNFELLLDRQGWRSHRLGGGLRAALGSRFHLDGGYFFESRRTNAGGDRHVWTTGPSYEWERHRHGAP
ncbi:MAG TPA: DUF2490 domain-containing protein [Bryobacteraceae bacterium]|nr:DUF2490 domain-containing protein [Bryobacteraceae bacterium]